MRRKAAILLMILSAVMIYTYFALGDYKMTPIPILGFIGLAITLQPVPRDLFHPHAEEESHAHED